MSQYENVILEHNILPFYSVTSVVLLFTSKKFFKNVFHSINIIIYKFSPSINIKSQVKFYRKLQLYFIFIQISLCSSLVVAIDNIFDPLIDIFINSYFSFVSILPY